MTQNVVACLLVFKYNTMATYLINDGETSSLCVRDSGCVLQGVANFQNNRSI